MDGLTNNWWPFAKDHESKKVLGGCFPKRKRSITTTVPVECSTYFFTMWVSNWFTSYTTIFTVPISLEPTIKYFYYVLFHTEGCRIKQNIFIRTRINWNRGKNKNCFIFEWIIHVKLILHYIEIEKRPKNLSRHITSTNTLSLVCDASRSWFEPR